MGDIRILEERRKSTKRMDLKILKPVYLDWIDSTAGFLWM